MAKTSSKAATILGFRQKRRKLQALEWKNYKSVVLVCWRFSCRLIPQSGENPPSLKWNKAPNFFSNRKSSLREYRNLEPTSSGFVCRAKSFRGKYIWQNYVSICLQGKLVPISHHLLLFFTFKRKTVYSLETFILANLITENICMILAVFLRVMLRFKPQE